MKIFKYLPMLNFKKPKREILSYKYLNHDRTVQAILKVDKNSGKVISFDQFTKENPYIEGQSSIETPNSNNTGFFAKYLKNLNNIFKSKNFTNS